MKDYIYDPLSRPQLAGFHRAAAHQFTTTTINSLRLRINRKTIKVTVDLQKKKRCFSHEFAWWFLKCHQALSKMMPQTGPQKRMKSSNKSSLYCRGEKHAAAADLVSDMQLLYVTELHVHDIHRHKHAAMGKYNKGVVS